VRATFDMKRIRKLSFLSGFLIFTICLDANAEMADIPVPLTTIEAGQKIENANLISKNFYVSDSAARLFVTTPTQAEGKIAKRALVTGKPISLSFLRLAGAVVQGAPTKVILEKDGLVITALLIPLQSGIAGQTIDARNPESGKIVKAIINADGSLQIGEQ
jgi:flagellar basal body P-ring formation protein FlgA